MRELITGYTVSQTPGVLYHTTGTIALEVGRTLAYDIGRDRWCTGYQTPAGDTGSCPDAAPATVGDTCTQCAQRTMLGPCITRCTGARCVNPQRYSSCVLVDHYTYLAFYAEDVIKVGVTKLDRFSTRIAEQGALGAIAIHAAGGQEVRRVETTIRKAGYIDRTDVVPLLSRAHGTRGDAEAALRQEAARIAFRLQATTFMTKGPFVWLADRYPPPLALHPRVLKPGADPLCGEIVGVRGGHVILRLPAFAEGMPRGLGVMTLRSLLGHEIVALTDGEQHGPQQAAMIF